MSARAARGIFFFFSLKKKRSWERNAQGTLIGFSEGKTHTHPKEIKGRERRQLIFIEKQVLTIRRKFEVRLWIRIETSDEHVIQ